MVRSGSEPRRDDLLHLGDHLVTNRRHPGGYFPHGHVYPYSYSHYDVPENCQQSAARAGRDLHHGKSMLRGTDESNSAWQKRAKRSLTLLVTGMRTSSTAPRRPAQDTTTMLVPTFRRAQQPPGDLCWVFHRTLPPRRTRAG